MKNQKINCNVKSCKFHDSKESCCNLKEIVVDSESSSHNAKDISSTICKSFECDTKKVS